MKKKILILAILLVSVITVVWAEGEGTLTVNNCPADATVFVCENNIPKTMMDFVGLIRNSAAVGLGDDSPFPLCTTSGEDFTETGTFLVIVMVDSDLYYIGNVSFKNGGAAVNFIDMKAQKDLPPI